MLTWNDCESRILVCGLGESPAVVVETLWGLRYQWGRRDPTQIHVISTAQSDSAGRGRVAVRDLVEQLETWFSCLSRLEAEPGSGIDVSLPQRIAVHLIATTGLTRRITKTFCITTENKQCKLVESGTATGPGNGEPRPAGKVLRELLDDPSALGDVRTEADNWTAAAAIEGLVRELVADKAAAIHASIAGGRKTMSGQLQSALMLWGRVQDEVSHVLVSESFETRVRTRACLPFPATGEDDAPVPAADSDDVILSRVPVLTLSGVVEAARTAQRGVVDLIERMHVVANAKPRIQIDVARRTLGLGSDDDGQPELSVELSPDAIAVYAWLGYFCLKAARQGGSGGPRPGSHCIYDPRGCCDERWLLAAFLWGAYGRASPTACLGRYAEYVGAGKMVEGQQGVSVENKRGELHWFFDAPSEVATLLDHNRFKSPQEEQGKTSKGYWKSWLQPKMSRMRQELEVALIYPNAVFYPRDPERGMGYGLREEFISPEAIDIADLKQFEDAAGKLLRLMEKHGSRIAWAGVA